MTPAGTCQYPGTRCYRTALVAVRIFGVGDRRICEPDLAAMDRLGMAYRRLPATESVPEWRTRLTARVLDHGAVGR